MFRYFIAVVGCLTALAGCGGGDSSVTSITGGGLNSLGASPSVWLSPTQGSYTSANVFVQKANNLEVKVDSGPVAFSLPNVNMLYATVRVCAPGDPSNCQDIDHVMVDTGSVGLRILASKVGQLGLAPDPATGPILECYPFVIGGLWGPTVVADVVLGQQRAGALPIQLIEDRSSTGAIQAPADCLAAANGQVLSTVSALGANGILGIGSTTLDCGQLCVDGNYAQSLMTYVPYWSCPANAASTAQCAATKVDVQHQVFNPVAALPKDSRNSNYADNNGVVLLLPQVTGLGAFEVHGELIFGIGTRANNQLAVGVSPIRLGVDFANNKKSYLNVTTIYDNVTMYNSYLDTGTNGLFFTNKASVTSCTGSTWYCPINLAQQNAVISDGDTLLPQNAVKVSFNVGNASSLFSTTNSAFGDLAGAPPSTSTSDSFSWGLPFFFGKRVALSIWQQPGSETGPWYSWSSL